MISSLEALSGFYDENTLKARRNLRGDVEKRSMCINKQFLEAYTLVDQVFSLYVFLHIFFSFWFF